MPSPNRERFDSHRVLAATFVETFELDFGVSPIDPARENVRSPELSAEVGDIWAVQSDSDHGRILMAITWTGSEHLRGVFILDEPALAASDDLVVPEDGSSCGMPMALCMWRDIPITHRQLVIRVGQLSQDATVALLMNLQQRLTGGFNVRVLDSSTNASFSDFVAWQIAAEGSSGGACTFLTGTAIVMADDPRRLVQDVIVSATAVTEAAALSEVFASIERADDRGTTLGGRSRGLRVIRSKADYQPISMDYRMAAATSAHMLLAENSVGEQLIMTLGTDGLGSVVNRSVATPLVHVVLTEADSGRTIPIGRVGESAQDFLPLDRGHAMDIWCDPGSLVGRLALLGYVPHSHHGGPEQ